MSYLGQPFESAEEAAASFGPTVFPINFPQPIDLGQPLPGTTETVTTTFERMPTFQDYLDAGLSIAEAILRVQRQASAAPMTPSVVPVQSREAKLPVWLVPGLIIGGLGILVLVVSMQR